MAIKKWYYFIKKFFDSFVFSKVAKLICTVYRPKKISDIIASGGSNDSVLVDKYETRFGTLIFQNLDKIM